jgi:hypothetical protein
MPALKELSIINSRLTEFLSQDIHLHGGLAGWLY